MNDGLDFDQRPTPVNGARRDGPARPARPADGNAGHVRVARRQGIRRRAEGMGIRFVLETAAT